MQIVLCGGECAEDITTHVRKELEQLKDFKVLNSNLKMNTLLVNLLLTTKQFSTSRQDYIFDYDNQFIPTGKHDSKRSYKKADGYFPGIASIDNHPVYIENRNGNSNVKYKQEETLTRAYKVLADTGIKVKHSRMDCGSFTKEVVNVVEANSDYFYIRAQRCDNLYEQLKEVTDWQTVAIGFKKYEIATINYTPFGKNKEKRKTYRYVVSRESNENGQIDLLTSTAFKYRAIMTNNSEMSDLEVVNFYNQRGESERLFDEMNNDFLWKKMPFSFLQENTVFLIMMAICRNLFHFLTSLISKKFDGIKNNFRLKKFIFRFMLVPAKWIKQGRQHILKLFSDKKYHHLLE